MNKKIILNIQSSNLYRLLLQSLRYARSRLNHLEPSGSFAYFQEVVLEYHDQDPDGALRTIKQACEETISDLGFQFFDGEDDDFGNRKEYLNFIQWCLNFIRENGQVDYVPYNYDTVLQNLDTDDKKQYLIINNRTKATIIDEKHLLSRKEYLTYIFKNLEHVKDGETVSYQKKMLSSRGEKYKCVYTVFSSTSKPNGNEYLVMAI